MKKGRVETISPFDDLTIEALNCLSKALPPEKKSAFDRCVSELNLDSPIEAMEPMLRSIAALVETDVRNYVLAHAHQQDLDAGTYQLPESFTEKPIIRNAARVYFSLLTYGAITKEYFDNTFGNLVQLEMNDPIRSPRFAEMMGYDAVSAILSLIPARETGRFAGALVKTHYLLQRREELSNTQTNSMPDFQLQSALTENRRGLQQYWSRAQMILCDAVGKRLSEKSEVLESRESGQCMTPKAAIHSLLNNVASYDLPILPKLAHMTDYSTPTSSHYRS